MESLPRPMNPTVLLRAALNRAEVILMVNSVWHLTVHLISTVERKKSRGCVKSVCM